MTKQELKELLTPIVCDLNLTKEERSNKLGPLAAEFMRDNPKLNDEDVFEVWNGIMVEIVEEYNLGRH